MKTVLVFASLSLMSALAAAAEVSVAAEACVAPVIPTMSTTLESVQQVDREVTQWDACVVKQASDDNKGRDAQVKAQWKAWQLATRQNSQQPATRLSNHQAALTYTVSQSAIDQYKANLDRIEQSSREQRQRLISMDRVTNDVPEGLPTPRAR
jgi:hypothetical protein